MNLEVTIWTPLLDDGPHIHEEGGDVGLDVRDLTGNLYSCYGTWSDQSMFSILTDMGSQEIKSVSLMIRFKTKDRCIF